MRLANRALTGSLLIRVLLVEALTFLAACIILPLMTLSDLRNSAASVQNEVLQSQAHAVAHGLQRTAGGEWRVRLDPGLRPIFDTGYDGRAYAIVNGAHEPVLLSRYAVPHRWPTDIYASGLRRFVSGPVSGLTLPVRIGDRSGWVVVTQDEAGPGAVVDDVMRAFLSRYLAALVALLVAMQLVNGLLLWHSFKKLSSVARAAALIGPRSLDIRLVESGMPVEIAALVGAVNGLLARVQAGFHQQEEFASNLAHELKTPLATLRVQVEQVADQAIRTSMIGQIDRMAHVLGQLRDLAALEHAADMQMSAVDLDERIIALVAEATPRVLASGHTIAVSSETRRLRVLGNSGLIDIAVNNLIDNALIHTPPGCHVELTLTRSGCLQVADDGPGIAEDQAPRLLRRFHRADHARSDGAGLGLSIVQRIADAHRANLSVGRAAIGGALFWLEFQLAPHEEAG